MRFDVVLRYVGMSMIVNGLFMAVSAVIGVGSDASAFMPLLYSAVVTACIGAFPWIFVPAVRDLTSKEGVLVVVLSWLVSCVVGMLPYLLWGGVFDVANAWFESVSGFTTTGASILSDVEALPAGLLFWRASTHWIGGIGIVLFVLAILPFVGLAEMVLVRNEVSVMAMDNLQARSRKVIRVLSTAYVGLTLLQTLALWICGMSLFDAVTHAFATVATGGFSTKNASIGHFDSPAIEGVIIVFMILSGMHFGLLYGAVTGRMAELWRSQVVQFYVAVIAISTGIVAWALWLNDAQAWPSAVRYAAFQVGSIATSTGFANADSSVWPAAAQLILLLLALQCACAGSTSGGIKTDRILISIKAFFRQLVLSRHPRGVVTVRMDGRALGESLVTQCLLYVFVYMVVVVMGTLIISGLDVDLLSAFSGAVACMGNVGPGLGKVGSMANYAGLSDAVKVVLSILMLLGRLEIFALLLLLFPAQWRRTTSY